MQVAVFLEADDLVHRPVIDLVATVGRLHVLRQADRVAGKLDSSAKLCSEFFILALKPLEHLLVNDIINTFIKIIIFY